MSESVQDEEVRETLNQFRNAVSNILKPLHDDEYLLRWLKARSFDVAKAEKMIRESFKIMRRISGEDILNSEYEMPEIAEKYLPSRLWGADKEGSPVRYVFNSKLDFRGFFRSVTVFDLLKGMTFLIESDLKAARENAKVTGKFNPQFVYVFDEKDLNFKQFLDKYLIMKMGVLLSAYQDNFPELLKTAYIINAPPSIQALIALSKPFLHENTLKKIRIFGSDGYQDEFLTIMDRKNLPKYYGGDLDDPYYDPDVFTLDMETIPSSYYIKDELLLKPTDPNISEIAVNERQAFCHRINVSKTGTTLKWVFQSKKNYNIKFGVFFQMTQEDENESTGTELVKPEFVESYYIPERGEVFCKKAGEYILHFDNTYSWFMKKHVLLKVDLEDPEEMNSYLYAEN